MSEQHRVALARAEASGATIRVRYTRGREYRDGFTVTGIVEGFVKRPRCAEKVRIRRAGETLITTDVPIGAITAIEAPDQRTTPDRALMFAIVERFPPATISSGPYTVHPDFPVGDAEFPWPMPPLDLITGMGDA